MTPTEHGLGVVPEQLTRFAVICMAATLIVCAARPAAARQVSSSPQAIVVTGRVVSQGGQPVAGAVVTIATAQVEVRTNTAGQFDVRLAAGHHERTLSLVQNVVSQPAARVYQCDVDDIRANIRICRLTSA